MRKHRKRKKHVYTTFVPREYTLEDGTTILGPEPGLVQHRVRVVGTDCDKRIRVRYADGRTIEVRLWYVSLDRQERELCHWGHVASMCRCKPRCMNYRLYARERILPAAYVVYNPRARRGTGSLVVVRQPKQKKAVYQRERRYYVGQMRKPAGTMQGKKISAGRFGGPFGRGDAGAGDSDRSA